MKFRLFVMAMAAMIIGGALFTGAAYAEEMSTQDKLDVRKNAFAKKAPAEKTKDYNDGIEAVAQSGVLEKAANVGDAAPDFTLPSASGEAVSLSKLLETGPVVMVWYRGEWCPYCNIYLEDIQDHAQQFKDAGAQIVAISPQEPDKAMLVQGKLELDFHVLSDLGSKTATDYGVIYTLPPKIAGYLNEAFDIKTGNQDDGTVLPLSASYVIDQDGVITYAFLDADYRKRADTKTLLEEVKKLR